MMEKETQNIVTDKQSKIIEFDKLGHLQTPILSSNKILSLPKSLFASYHLPDKSVAYAYQLIRKGISDAKDSHSTILLYAPPPIGFWALWAKASGNLQNTELVLNAPEFYSTFKLFVLRLRLKNERRLMGSDVPSPTMTHILRQWVSVADYFSFTIGEWLEMTQHTKHYLETLSTKISWLGKEDPSSQFNALLEN